MQEEVGINYYYCYYYYYYYYYYTCYYTSPGPSFFTGPRSFPGGNM